MMLYRAFENGVVTCYDTSADPLTATLACRFSEGEGGYVTIKFTASSNPPGKLAEAELHFDDGPLAGLKLIGFAVWERRTGGGRNVTFPARQYAVNGERRSFALLRPSGVDPSAQDGIRDLILNAYKEFEESGQSS